MAFHTVISVYRSVQFHHMFTSCRLVKSVDVLCHHTGKLSCLFHLGKFLMRIIRLRIQRQHLIPVEPVKLIRVAHEKCMA